MTVTEPFAGVPAQPTAPTVIIPGAGPGRHHRQVDAVDSSDPYQWAHSRCRAARGRVDDYRCVDCGDQAEEWSLSRRPLGNTYCVPHRGMALWVSDDVWDYQPRCSGCHRVRDWETRLRERDRWERVLDPPPYSHDPDLQGWYR